MSLTMAVLKQNTWLTTDDPLTHMLCRTDSHTQACAHTCGPCCSTLREILYNMTYALRFEVQGSKSTAALHSGYSLKRRI